MSSNNAILYVVKCIFNISCIDNELISYGIGLYDFSDQDMSICVIFRDIEIIILNCDYSVPIHDYYRA